MWMYSKFLLKITLYKVSGLGRLSMGTQTAYNWPCRLHALSVCYSLQMIMVTFVCLQLLLGFSIELKLGIKCFSPLCSSQNGSKSMNTVYNIMAFTNKVIKTSYCMLWNFHNMQNILSLFVKIYVTTF